MMVTEMSTHISDVESGSLRCRQTAGITKASSGTVTRKLVIATAAWGSVSDRSMLEA
jgi:hypothetical protein